MLIHPGQPDTRSLQYWTFSGRNQFKFILTLAEDGKVLWNSVCLSLVCFFCKDHWNLNFSNFLGSPHFTILLFKVFLDHPHVYSVSRTPSNFLILPIHSHGILGAYFTSLLLYTLLYPSIVQNIASNKTSAKLTYKEREMLSVGINDCHQTGPWPRGNWNVFIPWSAMQKYLS